MEHAAEAQLHARSAPVRCHEDHARAQHSANRQCSCRCTTEPNQSPAPKPLLGSLCQPRTCTSLSSNSAAQARHTICLHRACRSQDFVLIHCTASSGRAPCAQGTVGLAGWPDKGAAGSCWSSTSRRRVRHCRHASRSVWSRGADPRSPWRPYTLGSSVLLANARCLILPRASLATSICITGPTQDTTHVIECIHCRSGIVHTISGVGVEGCANCVHLCLAAVEARSHGCSYHVLSC